MKTQETSTSRWGRSRFGGNSAVLISTSLGIGILLAVGAGLLFARLNSGGNFVVSATIMAIALAPILSAAAWALLVDRSTLQGAIRNPEISVESQWYDKAAVGVFHDLLIIMGLGAAVFSFLQLSAPLGLVLTGILILAVVDFAVRYLLIKKVQG